jgi:hypothetical protein
MRLEKGKSSRMDRNQNNDPQEYNMEDARVDMDAQEIER